MLFPGTVFAGKSFQPVDCRRWTWGTTTIYLDNATYVDVGRICAEDAKQMADINGGSYVLMPQPISESMIFASEQAGDSLLGLRLRSQLCKPFH